jgi:CPA1 family monovalent cation:H+ antiporter
VAVNSLSSRIKIGADIRNTLMGEGLINDASGLIAFRFAAAALLTGSFSLGEALLQLVIVSLGGFLAGLALASLERHAIKALKKLSVRHTATYVLIELMMPFLCYMVAESAGVSGILAAVAAGSRQTPRLRQAKRLEAEFGSAKETMWEMLTFLLNSLVFLLMGLQLPSIFMHVKDNSGYSYTFLIFIVVLVTVILLGVRFLSVGVLASRITGKGVKEKLKNTSVLTLSGVKGTVSLATAFALPLRYADGAVFAERPLLLYMTAGVIILSLLIALVALPLVADKAHARFDDNKLRIDILKETVRQLGGQGEGGKPSHVALNYKKRIEELEENGFTRDEKRKAGRLWKLMYGAEARVVKGMRRRGEASERTFCGAMELLCMIYRTEVRGVAARAALWFPWMRVMNKEKWMNAIRADAEHLRNLKEVFKCSAEAVAEALEAKRGAFPDMLIDRLLSARLELACQMDAGADGNPAYARLHKDYESEMLNGFYVERRVIHQFLQAGRITEEEANIFRVDVNELESYVLSGKEREVINDINALVSKWRPQGGELSE